MDVIAKTGTQFTVKTTETQVSSGVYIWLEYDFTITSVSTNNVSARYKIYLCKRGSTSATWYETGGTTNINNTQTTITYCGIRASETRVVINNTYTNVTLNFGSNSFSSTYKINTRASGGTQVTYNTTINMIKPLSMYYNGVKVNDIYYNGTKINDVYYNGIKL